MNDGPQLDVRLARLEQHVSDIDNRGSRGLSRVETTVTRLEQRMIDTEARVAAMAPLTTVVTTLSERVGTLRGDFADFRRKIEEREDDNRRDRRVMIRWAVSLTITILVALIGLAVAIISSGGHP